MLSTKRIMNRALLLSILVCCLSGQAVAEDGAPTAPTTDSSAIEWVRHHAIPLTSDDPASDSDDLMFLKDLVGDARVVSLGEATHGTREFFRIKHRLVKFLVEDMGFTHFGIEASMPNCQAINDYVLKGTGDPEEALHRQGFWTWDTQEILALIEWMRLHNRNTSDGHKVRFFGYDMQNPRAAARIAIEFVEMSDSSAGRPLRQQFDRLFPDNGLNFWQVYEEYSPSERESLRQFTVSLISTIDLMKGDGSALPTGIDWSQARLYANVSSQCEKMMRMEKEFQPSIGVLEWYRIYDIFVESASGLADMLTRVGSPVADSLLIYITQIQEPRIFEKYEDLESDQERQQWKDHAARLVSFLTSSQTHCVAEAGDSAYKASCSAAQDIVLAWQCLDEYAAMPEARPNIRDQAMAENIAWTLDQAGSGARIVLWAHNLHVMRKPEDPGYGSMGNELEQKYGDDHFVIGFSFNRGSFQAAFMDVDASGNYTQKLGPFSVKRADDGTIPWLFAQVELPLFFIDLRDISSAGAAAWLSDARPMRAIGAGYSNDDIQKYFESVILPEHFDAVIFVDSTSAATPSERTRVRFNVSGP